MLEKLRITNFQAHADTTITLDPHVTTIVGSSDAGKSAVVRALRWVCTNKPGGESFVRDGTDEAQVTLRVDGQKLRRVRGKGRNTYALGAKKLKAFGAGVPEPVAKLLNLSDINFQGQHDAPFWFSDTGGDVSKKLNAIVDLSIVDSVLAEIGAELRTATALAVVTEQRLGEARASKKDLAFVKDMDLDVTELERMAADLTERHQTASRLRLLLQEVSRHTAAAQAAQDLRLAGEKMVTAGDALAGKVAAAQKLLLCVTLAETNTAAASLKIPTLAKVEHTHAALETAFNQRAGLWALRGLIENQIEDLEYATEKQTETATAFDSAMAAQGVCQLCGRKTRKVT